MMRSFDLVIVSILIALCCATSDRTIKRRNVRLAWQADQALEQQEDADFNVTHPGYNRAMKDMVRDVEGQLGLRPFRAITQTINMTYLQCIFHAQRWVKLHVDPATDRLAGRFLDLSGNASTNAFRDMGVSPDMPACGPTRVCSNLPNPCALYFIPYEELFSGVDKVILVGDSTALRDFKYMENIWGGHYKEKVSELRNPHLVRKLKRSSGAPLELHFFRLLYASLMIGTVEEVMKIATPRSVMLWTLGPHDTSWLIFDRQTFYNQRVMPGMMLAREYDKHTGKRYNPNSVVSNNFARAKVYWEKHVTAGVQVLAASLRDIENRERARRTAAGEAVDPTLPLRPFVAFREQFMPKCSDPKYANRPHTRCTTHLKPRTVPMMRSFLHAQVALVNIPMIGMDALSARPNTPCYLMDAGHLPRPCKSIELLVLGQSFRLARRLRIRQGFPIDPSESFYGRAPSTHNLAIADGASLHHVTNRITLLRPRGMPYPDPALRTATYEFELLIVPPAAAFSSEERELFSLWDDPAKVQRDLTPCARPMSTKKESNTDDDDPLEQKSPTTHNHTTADQLGPSAPVEGAVGPGVPEGNRVNGETPAEGGALRPSITGRVVTTAPPSGGDSGGGETETFVFESTFRRRVSSAPKLGFITLSTFFALTTVVVFLWQRLE